MQLGEASNVGLTGGDLQLRRADPDVRVLSVIQMPALRLYRDTPIEWDAFITKKSGRIVPGRSVRNCLPVLEAGARRGFRKKAGAVVSGKELWVVARRAFPKLTNTSKANRNQPTVAF